MASPEQDVDVADLAMGPMTAEEIDALLQDTDAMVAEVADNTSPPEPSTATVENTNNDSEQADQESLDQTKCNPLNDIPDVEEALDRVTSDIASIEADLGQTASSTDTAKAASQVASVRSQQHPSDGDIDGSSCTISQTTEPAAPHDPSHKSVGGSLRDASADTDQPSDDTPVLDALADRSSTWKPIPFATAEFGIRILVLLDKPFARVSTGTKTFLGIVGIGTLVIATATWLIGPLL